VCPYIQKQGEQWWPLFVPQADINDIPQFLATIVVGGTFSDDGLAAIKVTHRSLTNCDWTSLASTLQERIGANQSPSSTETNVLLQGLSLLRKLGCAQAGSSLDQLAANGHLMHRLNQAHSEKDFACMARLLMSFIEQRPGIEKPSPIGKSEAGYTNLMNLLASNDPEMAKHMVDLLDAEDKVNMLFEIVDNRGSYDPLVVACLRLITDSNAPERLFTPDVVMDRWSDLRNQLKKEDDDLFEKLIGHLCLNLQFVDAVQKRKDGFNVKDAWLYFRICTACSSQTFRKWCQDGLEALDATGWKSQLDQRGDALTLLLFLIEEGIKIALKQPFQDALVDHAKDILAGRARPEDDLVKKWPMVLDAMGSPPSRESLRRRLLLAAMNQDGICADSFFQIYGDELSSDTTSFYKEKDIVAKLFSPLLRERNVSGLRWLNIIFGKITDLLEKSEDRSAVVDFLERLQGELGKPADNSDQAHTIIVDIATILGITKKAAYDVEGSGVGGLKTEEEK